MEICSRMSLVKKSILSASSPLVLCLLPLCLFQIIVFGQKWIPLHDTLSDLFYTHYFLRQFAETGEIPLWSPHLNWGRDNNLLLLVHFSPFQLALAPLVRILSSLNIIHLLYASLFLEECMLLAGTYAFASLLYSRTASVVFVTLSLTGTALWLGQIFFNFRIYYSLPLVLYFIWKGCQTSQLWRIGVALFIALLTGCMGNAIYPLIVQSLVVTIFFCTWFWIHRPHPRFGFGRKEAGALIANLILVTVLAVFLTHGVHPVFNSPGREIEGSATYEKFVNLDRPAFFEGFSGILDGLGNDRGYALDYNATAYGGLLMLPLALFALLMRPHVMHTPFVISGGVLFLFWLGWQSFLGPLLYYVPGASLFRQSFLLSPLIKLQLIFLAGFGLDALADKISCDDGRNGVRGFLVLFLVFFALFCGRLRPVYHHNPSSLVVLVLYVGFLVSILIAAIHGGKAYKLVITSILILTAIDVFSYRSRVFHQKMIAVPQTLWDRFHPRPLPFPIRRHENYHTSMIFKQLSPFIPRLGEFYNITEPFCDFEPCHSIFRQDTSLPWVGGVYRRFSLPNKIPQYLSSGFSDLSMLHLAPQLKHAIGCGSSKLRILSAKPGERFPDSPVTFGPGKIAVDHFRANRVFLTLDRPTKGKAWLYYSDAWHPFWRATVNGQEQTVERAFGAFKAVQIPSGRSEVEFIYESPLDTLLIKLLWGISCLFAVGFLAVSFRALFNRHRQPISYER